MMVLKKNRCHIQNLTDLGLPRRLWTRPGAEQGGARQSAPRGRGSRRRGAARAGGGGG